MRNYYLMLLAASLCFVGCFKQRVVIDADVREFRYAPLSILDASWHHRQYQVSVLVKKMESEDCWQDFGVNPIASGYQPLKITISNFSEKAVYLNPTTCGLPLTHPKKVAKACHWRNWELSGGSSILAAIYFWPALVGIGGVSYSMHQRNKTITKNLMGNQTLYYQDVVKVRPLQSITRVIFVPEQCMQDRFTLVLYSKQTKEFLDFKVDLEA